MKIEQTPITPVNRYFLMGSISGLVVVLLGAFGAHALRSQVTESLFSAWQTGVLYQAIHGLVLLMIGMFPQSRVTGTLNYAGRFFVAGILLFSGSLYLMVLLNLPAMGMLTPVGGVALLLGWVMLIVFAWREGKRPGG